MKKTKEISTLLIKKLIELLNHNFNKKDDLEITANALMGIIFNERNTNDSIELMQLLQQKANAELAKRKTLAILEKNSVDFYFKKENKSEGKAIKIDYQIINN